MDARVEPAHDAGVGGLVPVQTSFTLAQLADPNVAEADRILRTCVHCGFCTATCPTYVLLGDELDSPRWRLSRLRPCCDWRPPGCRRSSPGRGGACFRRPLPAAAGWRCWQAASAR